MSAQVVVGFGQEPFRKSVQFFLQFLISLLELFLADDRGGPGLRESLKDEIESVILGCPKALDGLKVGGQECCLLVAHIGYIDPASNTHLETNHSPYLQLSISVKIKIGDYMRVGLKKQ